MSTHTDPSVVKDELALFKAMLHQFLKYGLSLSDAIKKANARYSHHTPKEDTIALGITQVLHERGEENKFARFDAESGMLEIIESIPWERKRSPSPAGWK